MVATVGQSARCGWRLATSTVVRIVASGLRSSWDASDTNWRWRSLRGVEPVEHVVHRVRQPGDLVVGGRLVDAAVERRVADLLDLLAHALDRPQGAVRRATR